MIFWSVVLRYFSLTLGFQIEQYIMEEYQYKMHNVCGNQSSGSEENAEYYRVAQKIIITEFDRLRKAKQRFKLFIEEIKEEAFAPIREDIINYCEGQRRTLQEKNKPDHIMKKIEIRIDKMLKTKRIKRNWGTEDLCILIWIISKYCDYKNIHNLEKDITMEDWNFIATLIPGVSGESCMFKWLSIKKITLANHNWTKMESELLGKIVKQKLNICQSGQIRDWKQISQDLYKDNTDIQKVYRNAKQCREHWTCYLSPQLKKGPWQLYEDVKLLKFIKDNKGLKKWSQIARFFQGRTENALKNRYTLIIQKQKKPPKNRHKTELQLISQYLQKCYVDQFTSNIKFEEESIYQDQSQNCRNMADDEESKNHHMVKKQEVWYETKESNEIVLTPMRVQKFNIMDFESMSFTFFKSIQPGVIESDGKFKKIQNTGIKLAYPGEIFTNSEKHKKFKE